MFQATHTANPVRVNATTILDVTDVTDRSDGKGQSCPDLMLRLADGRNFKADSSMTSRYVPVTGDYLVTQEDGYEYLNPKDVFERKYSPTSEPEAITFSQFVQYGRDNGGNIVNGMPWSFNFKGHPVTHENDRCYLVGVNAGQLRFTPDDVLVVAPDGSLSTRLTPGIAG